MRALKRMSDFVSIRSNVESVAKRRKFYYPSFSIYGGAAGYYTYGVNGVQLKNNLISYWKKYFLSEEYMCEIEDPFTTPANVLKASGHVERFNDYAVKELNGNGAYLRADKIIIEVLTARKSLPEYSEKYEIYDKILSCIDSASMSELNNLIKEHDIKSTTNSDLGEVFPINLMFPITAGPGSEHNSYLRPETAQGIFLNFKDCLQELDRPLPIGIAQIGKSFRNEISPRGRLLRQREFTQAEIEFFVNPKDKSHPKFNEISDNIIPLYLRNCQESMTDPIILSIGEAVEKGYIASQALAYYVACVYRFALDIGIQKEHIRLRQHLANEMAHYAEDCFDLEVNTSRGWIECVGIADRSAYDLQAHMNETNQDLRVTVQLDTPKKVTVLCLPGSSLAGVMKQASAAQRHLINKILSLEDMGEQVLLIEKAKSEDVTFEFAVKDKATKEDIISEYTANLIGLKLDWTEKTSTTGAEKIIPHVIEPSFGIDRLIFCILEHNYIDRGMTTNEITRSYFSFPKILSPYRLAIVPLDQRIKRDPRYQVQRKQLISELQSRGISYFTDDSSVSIGKRYSRADEIGTKYIMTFDFDSLENETVTLREIETMTQTRMSIQSAICLL